MKFNFEKKRVLITGSSRGIGLETAAMFAKAGAKVAVHYNSNDTIAKDALKSLEGTGHILIKGDLFLEETPLILVQQVVEKLGGIDIVVNNAGIFEEHPPSGTSYEEWKKKWDRTIKINLIAPVNITYCAAKEMQKNGGGKVINISSRGAFRGEPEAPAYGASKGGLNSFSQSMAKALAKDNVYVYSIAPGFVETDMALDILNGPLGDSIRNQSPLGRVAKPEEIARTVLFLASDGTEFLTGGIIDVNGASYLRS